MKSTKKLLWAFSLLMPLLIISATGNVFGVVPDDSTDDFVPEITARVARISYITGDVQIRRAESREWKERPKICRLSKATRSRRAAMLCSKFN